MSTSSLKNQSYSILHYKNFVILKLSTNVDSKDAQHIEEILKKVFLAETDTIIIDCESVKELAMPWVRAIAQIATLSKKVSLKLRLASASKKLLDILKHEGLDGLFPLKEDLRQALLDANQLSPAASMKLDAIDTRYLNIFADASIYVLKIQLSIEAKLQKTMVGKQTDVLLPDLVVGVQIKSEILPGWILMKFAGGVLPKLVAKYMKNTAGQTSSFNEGLGKELLNMIYSRAKVNLNANKLDYPSNFLPVVLKDDLLKTVNSNMRAILIFQSDAGQFRIEVSPQDSAKIQISPQ